MSGPLWRSFRAHRYGPADILRYFGVYRPPVNVQGMLQVLGVELYHIYDNNVAGALDTRDGTARVYVFAMDPPQRQRFTMAHELGHLMLHDLSVAYRDKRFREPPTAAESYLETQANRFAADLLIPPWMVRALAPEHGNSVDSLAAAFNVSRHSMSIRLAQVGLA